MLRIGYTYPTSVVKISERHDVTNEKSIGGTSENDDTQVRHPLELFESQRRGGVGLAGNGNTTSTFGYIGGPVAFTQTAFETGEFYVAFMWAAFQYIHLHVVRFVQFDDFL
jgi:hypothetical protein